MSSRSNARSATNVPVNTRTSLLRLRFVHRDRVDAHPQSRDSLQDPPPRERRGAQKDCDPRRALGGEPESKAGPRNAPELPVLSMQEYKKLGRSARRKSDGPPGNPLR